MKRNFNISKRQIILISFFLLFLVMLIVSLLVRTNKDACEWWSLYIGRWCLAIPSFVFGFLPFSIMEVYFISLVIICITLLVLLIKDFKKKNKIKAINKIGLIVTLIFGTVSTYFFICGPMYGRHEVNIPLYQEKVEQKEFKNILSFFNDDFNYCASLNEFYENGDIKNPYTISTLGQLVSKDFDILNSSYFSSYTSRIKPMMTSFIYRELQITGVSFAISGEANINYLCDTASIAYTMAHELAHQKGVMREDDANLVALYVCLNSNDPFIRFSGYINCYYSLLDLMNYTGFEGDYDKALYNLDSKILNYWNYSNNYWASHSLGEKIGNFFNDLYLKLNGTKGTSTYIDDYVTPPSDSGHKGDQGETIYNIEFTPFQKLFFNAYFNNTNSN